MCGILGLVIHPQSPFSRSEFQPLLDALFHLSESRGKDASGLALFTGEQIAVLKRPERARSLIRSREYRALLAEAVRQSAGAPLVAIGHARMVTNGTEETHENNQPVIRHNRLCLHNGIVVNDTALWSQFPDLKREFEVDTEVILSLVDRYCQQGLPLVDATLATFRHLQGANSIVLLANDRSGLILATTNGSLYYALSPSRHELVFVSERYILEQVLKHPALRELFAGATVAQVTPGTGYAFAFDDLQPCPFRLDQAGETGCALPALQPALAIRDLRAAPRTVTKRPVSTWTDRDTTDNDRLVARVNAAVASLRRCTRCLLPETFPFIRFDADGVCNYCHNYHPRQAQGESRLEELVAPYRKSSGQPDCLVPLSGGRDSSFGLHYIKTVLHMHPVAYTYDWGMVTDLARRNISRMCGQLGVEHVLISADIRRKRENIRKNVLAWLKKPDLGTVPLFMAGDKQFFYYAHMLKKQMDLGIVFFNMNPLERTDFKVGFCGIDENYQKEKHYNLSWVNKLRLAFYYGRQFVQNPAYLNSTMRDSLFAFFSYYLIPQDYYTLYDYIDWDESPVRSVLIPEYKEAGGNPNRPRGQV